MNIGLDFDGVIVNTDALKPVIAEKMFGVKIEPQNYNKKYVFSKNLLTPEQYLAVAVEVHTGNHPFEEVPGALEHIKMLQEFGCNISVVTSRSFRQGNLGIAQNWIWSNGLDLPIIGIPYGSSKVEACRELDMFIDDDLDVVVSLIGIVPHPFLFSWPHKVWDNIPREITQVRSWNEFYMYVYTYSK